MVSSPDSELVCAMDNKKNNSNNCRDDDACEYMKKSTANSETKQNKQQQQQKRGQQQSRFVCTTNSWLIFVHLSKFLPYIILNSARHWSKSGPRARVEGGAGEGERESDVDADSESLWVPVGAWCAASVGQWLESMKSLVKLRIS